MRKTRGIIGDRRQDHIVEIIKVSGGTKERPVSRLEICKRLGITKANTVSPTLTHIVRSEKHIHRRKTIFPGESYESMGYWFDDKEVNKEFINEIGRSVEPIKVEARRVKNLELKVTLELSFGPLNLSPEEARSVYKQLSRLFG